MTLTDNLNQEEIDSYLDIVFAYLRGIEQNEEFEHVLTDSLNNATFTNDVITEEEEQQQLIDQPYDPMHHLNTTMCPILQTPFERNEPVTMLPCNHAFNPEAIRTWLKQHNSLCPVCRYNLKSSNHSSTSDLNPSDTPIPLLANTTDPTIYIYDYGEIHPEPLYVTVVSSDTIYYNIYYRYRNNILPTQYTLLHTQD